MDPKPRAPYRASAEEWTVLRWAVGYLQHGLCLCGCSRPIGSVHHLVSRGQDGDDVLSNLAGLSGDGTRGCHGALTSGNRVNDNGTWITPDFVREGIRRYLRDDQIAYIVNRTGEWYLDGHYPKEEDGTP